METLEQLLRKDLDYIVENLRDEFSRIAGKKLLITGGGGFLGYYLVQSALHWNRSMASAHHIDVTVFDNYARGVPQWLTAMEGDKRLHLVRHDMIQPLPDSMDNFQYIIHAAGIASPIYYRKHPLETMDANINGLRNLFEYSRHQQTTVPVEGFLFYSSSEIYGDPPPDKIPTSEDYRGNVSCTGPRACYDESKRYGETLCVTYARQFGLPITSARPFNNYGPGLKITDRRVIPDFALDIVSNRDIVMLSDGAPKRTFCYSADAIVGYYKVLVKGRPGEAYNVGIERPEISMKELAEKMVATAKDLFGYTGKAVFKVSQEKDYLVDNPNRRCPDITKARTELSYNPSIFVDEGLRRSLVWYHYNNTGENA